MTDGNFYNLLVKDLSTFNLMMLKKKFQKGEIFTLYIDMNSKFYGSNRIAELWNGEECYLSYDEYLQKREESKKDASSLKWIITLIPLIIASMIAYYWK